jgi:hypothetical protein
VKGKDAEITLKLVANHIGRYAKPFEPKFRMADCHLFDAQYQRDRRVKREDGEVPLSEIDSHLALHSEFFERTNWDANNRLAARVFAEVMQLNPSQEEIQSEANRFCCIHGITDDVKLGFWLENNDLSMSEFWDLMLENAKIHKLHKALHVSKVACRNTKTVLDHLRITGEYPSAADESAAMEMAINRVAPDFMHNPVSRQPIDELLSEHCQDTGIRISTDLQIWLREAGFHSENELRIDLARSRILRGKS